MKRYCLLERMLHRYHDGSLDGGRRQRFEQHLHGCVLCTRQLHALEDTDALLVRTRPQTPELATAAQQRLFRTALAASQTGLHRSPWPRRWRLATGIALLVAMFGGLARQSQSTAHGVVTARIEAEHPAVKRVTDDSPMFVAKVEPPPVFERPRSDARHFGRRRSGHAPKRHHEPAPSPAVAAWDAPQVDERSTDEMIREEPRLLVLATLTTSTPALNVTVSTSDEPGYATAVYTTITPSGTQVVTQATISSCTPDHPGAEPDETATPDEAPDQDLPNPQERENSDEMD